MTKEIQNASMLLKDPKRPFTAIVGGAKVSDKILIIQVLFSFTLVFSNFKNTLI